MLLLAVLNFGTNPAILGIHFHSDPDWAFYGGLMIGAWVGRYLIQNHLQVLIHELKHAVYQNMVGNRGKSIRIRKTSGHYGIEYSEDTKQYNAFIALAPYWLPMFSVPGLLLFH